MDNRKEKMTNMIKELGADFLMKENNRTSLVTVTGANVSPDFKKATIFITVFPENQEKKVLNFAKRRGADMRLFLKKNMQTKTVPFVTIEIDKGEKNRQRIDELLKEK